METGKALPRGSFYINAVSCWDELGTWACCRNLGVYYIFLLPSTYEWFYSFYWTRKTGVSQYKGELARKPTLRPLKIWLQIFKVIWWPNTEQIKFSFSVWSRPLFFKRTIKKNPDKHHVTLLFLYIWSLKLCLPYLSELAWSTSSPT